MHTFIILRTKPRLSQAGALLLPKDSVSLGIRISLWQRYIFVLTIPTKPFFFLKELMRILQKTIRCAWLTPWLRAWILKVSESCIRNAGAALTTPGWCSRSFCMPIWTTSTPAGKLKSSFTVTSIISGWPDMRNRISLPSTVSATGWRRKSTRCLRKPYFFSLPKASSAWMWNTLTGQRSNPKPTSTLSSGEKRLSGTVNAWWRRYISC